MRGFLILCLALASCSETRRFDRAEWANADLSGRARADMLPDLLRRHPLEGRTRADVIALLGEPTPTDKWEGADMIYVLGNDGTWTGVDHEWLLIELDRRHRVEWFTTVRD